MRLIKISVKQLFNAFDHSISLKVDSGITILHGPNGVGKTTLLRMVRDVLTNRLYALRGIPFDEFSLEFDNDSKILIRKKLTDASSSVKPARIALEVTHLIGDEQTGEFEYTLNTSRESIERAALWIDGRIPGASRVGTDRWQSADGEVFSTAELVEKYSEILPVELRMPRQSEWYKRITSSLPVRLIETQRLVRTTFIKPQLFESMGDRPQVPVISALSAGLVQLIQKKFAEYAALSQSLDRSFPVRLVQQKEKISLSDEQLHVRFKSIDEKRSRLEQAGLLGREDTGFEIPPEMEEATRSVLSVYIHDVERKLSVFDDIAARIDLFRQIINDRFIYKTLGISKSDGFAFISTRTGEELEASALSSGEQHEVVLLYELLFQLSPNSLIMIDEPEISLHIAWQEQFLDDLKHIIELSKFDVIIATHSPQIVNDRWDLTIGLNGPEDASR